MENAPAAVQSFLDFIKFEKRYSRHTISSYQTDLVSFFNYLQASYGEMEIRDITHIYIRSWLAQLKDEGNDSRTIARKISTLKSFYKFLLRQGEVQTSPMLKIITPKQSKKLPAFVSEDDIRKLFEQIPFADTFRGYTEKLILQLLYATGIRLSELIQLRAADVNTSNRSIKVLGKGNKERIIPVAPELISVIGDYNRLKADKGFAASVTLLVDEHGAALKPRKVYESVHYYLTAVSSITKRSPHVLRHTFATHLMNNGADLNAVKELLGHSNLAATQVYTHNTIDKLKAVYKKAHPKG